MPERAQVQKDHGRPYLAGGEGQDCMSDDWIIECLEGIEEMVPRGQMYQTDGEQKGEQREDLGINTYTELQYIMIVHQQRQQPPSPLGLLS